MLVGTSAGDMCSVLSTFEACEVLFRRHRISICKLATIASCMEVASGAVPIVLRSSVCSYETIK